MTPDTTPDPMTHEEALRLLDASDAMFRVCHGEENAAEFRALRAYIEAERTRAEALAADRDGWEKTARHASEIVDEAMQEVRRLRAKRAELEAKVGRCEALAEQWTYTGKATNADDTDTLLDQCAGLLRTAIRDQRTDTGRGDG